MPQVWIVYGGIFPTYHWREILDAEPQIDVIVRGEGEETAHGGSQYAKNVEGERLSARSAKTASPGPTQAFSPPKFETGAGG